MIRRQEGGARSAATKRALQMAEVKQLGRRMLKPTLSRSTFSWSVRPMQPIAVGFFLRGRIADEFRDNTFADCLSEFQ